MRSTNDSILEDGKLKPGIYKIQNLYTVTYLDVHQHSKLLCCRPAQDLQDGGGLWEIKRSGIGYTVQRIEPGTPEQFCAPMEGLNNGAPLQVTPYSAAWRIEIVNDDILSGFEYVRFFWGLTKKTWDLAGGKAVNGTNVNVWDVHSQPHQIWKLIPVRVEGTFTSSRPPSEKLGLGYLPPYDGNATTRAQRLEPELDEFGTIVDEVTVVTTTSTVTTRKRYRVDDS